MQSFTLFDNEHGTLTAAPEDPGGNASTVTGEAATVDQPTILSVSPGTAADQFTVTAQGTPGIAIVTVTGTNAAGQVISTQFQFTISAQPASGFSGMLTGVASN